MFNFMIALAIWDFAFLILVAGAVGAGFVAYKGTKFAIKKIKRIKIKRQTRQEEMIEQAEAAAVMQPERKRFFRRNILHTIENYKYATGINSDYSNRQRELQDLQNELEVVGEIGDKNSRKLYRRKKSLNAQTLQPDYVKKDKEGRDDKTTYIQVGDEDLAREFKEIAEKDETQGIPHVCTISFNQEAGLADLRLSTPSESVFRNGRKILLKKLVDELSQIENVEAYFPIIEKYRFADIEREKVYENELDIVEEMPEYFQDPNFEM